MTRRDTHMRERMPGEDDLDLDPFGLARFNDDYDAAEDPTLPVPSGTYTAQIDHIEKTTARASGNPILRWTLSVVGPECVGRRLWRSHGLSTSEQFGWLKRDLHALGIRLRRLSDLPAHLHELIGLHIEVTVRATGDRQNLYFERSLGPGPNYRGPRTPQP